MVDSGCDGIDKDRGDPDRLEVKANVYEWTSTKWSVQCLLTLSTMTSDVIGERHVTYGATLGTIVDEYKERRMLRR